MTEVALSVVVVRLVGAEGGSIWNTLSMGYMGCIYIYIIINTLT